MMRKKHEDAKSEMTHDPGVMFWLALALRQTNHYSTSTNKTPPITLAASNHFNKSLHAFIDLYAVILSDGRGYLTYTAYKLEAIIKRCAIIDPNVTGTFEDGIWQVKIFPCMRFPRCCDTVAKWTMMKFHYENISFSGQYKWITRKIKMTSLNIEDGTIMITSLILSICNSTNELL